MSLKGEVNPIHFYARNLEVKLDNVDTTLLALIKVLENINGLTDPGNPKTFDEMIKAHTFIQDEARFGIQLLKEIMN